MNIQTTKSRYGDDIVSENDETKEPDPYIIYDITSYPSDFTLQGIVDAWRRGDIVIPDFQRGFVWSIKQSSMLIESFIIGLPVPPVFFFIDEDNKVLVIDGQQRIMSIVYFFNGYFESDFNSAQKRVFKLTGLHDKSPYKNKCFSDLDNDTKRILQNIRILRAINIQQLNPTSDKSSAYPIFERLNTQGTPLKSQEIRNVVYRGGFVNILNDLNKTKDWRQLIGQKEVNKHFSDVELVLRLFALVTHGREYESPMKRFLNETMSHHREGDTPEVHSFISRFPDVCALIRAKLGAKPFHVRGPINTALLDCVFNAVYCNIDRIPDDLKIRYNNLVADTDITRYTQMATTDKSNVHERLKRAVEILINR